MYMAELENQLLTAGHDLDGLSLPLTLDVSSGMERYIILAGHEQTLKPGDMFIKDREAVISSIIHGPDIRSRINPETKNVIFCVYAPDGIHPSLIQKHLEAIENMIQQFAPGSRTDMLQIFGGK